MLGNRRSGFVGVRGDRCFGVEGKGDRQGVASQYNVD